MLEFIKDMQELNVNRPFIKDDKIIAFNKEHDICMGNPVYYYVTCEKYRIHLYKNNTNIIVCIPMYESLYYAKMYKDYVVFSKAIEEKLKIFKDGTIPIRDFNDVGINHIDDITEEELFYLKLTDKI